MHKYFYISGNMYKYIFPPKARIDIFGMTMFLCDVQASDLVWQRYDLDVAVLQSSASQLCKD